ncbi:hypothetical protein CYMTET_33170 [Cymbomonas tetramitiformis]|uniref:Uncharacterized protein n=1 Tax=Cymbomonas tetramitiformis TaxID=36881 RepID=A0AAE0FDH2_9CHLO|nr:hypothetical protein CYMTET_33170 [Cymbomonas tetramitiformis]
MAARLLESMPGIWRDEGGIRRRGEDEDAGWEQGQPGGDPLGHSDAGPGHLGCRRLAAEDLHAGAGTRLGQDSGGVGGDGLQSYWQTYI